MLIKRTDPFSLKSNAMEIDVNPEKLYMWDSFERKPGTPLIQDFFPELTDDEREFILTGITPKEWGALFPEEEA